LRLRLRSSGRRLEARGRREEAMRKLEAEVELRF